MKARVGWWLLVLMVGFLTGCSYFRWGERSVKEEEQRAQDAREEQKGQFAKPLGD
jgi:hypothetical protein